MGSAQKGWNFLIVDELRSRYPLAVLLKHAGISRSGFYKWKSTFFKQRENDTVEMHITAIHSLRPYYGYRRMSVALKREGLLVNHKRVYRLMRKLGIQSTIRKKRKFFGRVGSSLFPNLLKRDFSSMQPGRKLVTDITYIPVKSGFMYLSVIQDLHNNEIISHNMSNQNNLDLVFATLRALPRHEDKAILHSDQGFQYTHKTYADRLTEMNLRGSHSRKGNCLDNAAVESFFSHLKTEIFATQNVLPAAETMILVEEYIRFYNAERFQKRLGQLSPVEYREKLAA